MAGNNLLLAKILRDSNTTQGGENALAEQFPRVYGALRGLLGTAPDEVGGSVLDGSHQAQKSGAGASFLPGLLAGSLPSAKAGTGLAALAGMFVGKGSKTWDALQATKAIQMERAGSDARNIWGETGTWKGPDGMWRQEIPDNAMQIKSLSELNASDRAGVSAQRNQLLATVKAQGGKPTDAQKFQMNMLNNQNISDSYRGTMGDALKHDDLYSAYPNMAHTKFNWMEMPSGTKGEYDPSTGIALNMGIFGKDAESFSAHELQHAIQNREGFARGGSPEGLPESLAGDAQSLRQKAREMFASGDRASGLAMEKQARQLDGVMTMATNKPAWAYQNLAGEAEARATQARIPLDVAQRRALFPEDSYDVPMNQLIVRGLLQP